MKKALPLFIVLFFFGNTFHLKAQCYGYVKFDQSANGNGSSTFTINTTHSNELILIGYDGWPGTGGQGPVTVDGNNATYITSTYAGYYSGAAQVYCYSATAVGTHTIICTETGYSTYYLNMASAFYDSATCTPLSCTSLTTAVNSVNNSGITNTCSLTTTTPNELIFSTMIFNTGISNPYDIADTGATATATLHVLNGLDANVGYTAAPTIGSYTVSASDPNTCVSCGGAMVLIGIIPGTCSTAFTVSSSITQPSCRNNDGKISLTLTGGTPPFTYTWTPNVSSNANATGLSAGRYIVKVTSNDGACSTVIDTFNLTGPTTTMTSKDAKCVPANSGTATVTITNGKTPFTYLWSNGQSTQTATGLTAGKYLITITDGIGCISHDSVIVGTYPAPVVTALPVSDSVCYAAGKVLTASGAKTYTWSPVAGLSCSNCASPTASPAHTTIYTVTGTDSNGCTNTATVTLKVIPLPPLVITGRDTICIGSSTTLEASGGTTYLWNPGAGTGTTYVARPPLTTTYTVKATTDGCSKDTMVKVTVVPIPHPVIKASKDSVCLGDTLTLSASGGTIYRWSPGNSTNVSIHPNLLNQTTYTLYAYGGTCEDSTTQTIKVIQPVTASLIYSRDSVCPNDTITLTAIASGGTLSYKWNDGETTASIHVNDTVTTSYTVTVTGTCGSKQVVTTIYVIPLPKLTIGGSLFECQGGIDTLTVSSSTNPTKYVWSTGKTGTSIIETINGDKTYTVVATNSLGCSVTNTISIKEAPNPGVSLTYPKACGVGNFVTITADTSGGTGPYKYSWSSGGTKDTTVVYVEKSGTIFTLTVSNQYGCTATAAATIVIDTPQLYACCSATILLGGDTGIIASGLGITKLQWSPPNSGLSCYTCPNPTATPTVTTTYTVSGTDSADCPVERTVTIMVETPCYNFIVPNVFTPTNAGALGLDNILYIPTHGFTSWSLLIFDRWGHEVFKSTDPNKYWDGNNESGASAPEGVYYYVIDAKCTGNSFEKNGFIQLIR